MNEFVELPEPSLTRNSLILIALTFRTFCIVNSECFAPVAAFVHCARPAISPLKAAGPDEIVNVALTVARGPIGSANVADVFVVAFITALVQLDPLMSVSPGIGVMYFMAVVVLTMIAAHTFDPRLIWNPGVPGRSPHA